MKFDENRSKDVESDFWWYEEGYFFVDGGTKIKFYVAYVTPFIMLYLCMKFDENRSKDVKIDIWRRS